MSLEGIELSSPWPQTNSLTIQPILQLEDMLCHCININMYILDFMHYHIII